MVDFAPFIELANENGAAYYKTAALPTELIRQPADFLSFCGKCVNLERAESAGE